LDHFAEIRKRARRGILRDKILHKQICLLSGSPIVETPEQIGKTVQRYFIISQDLRRQLMEQLEERGGPQLEQGRFF
jgi:hypothetical protein